MNAVQLLPSAFMLFSASQREQTFLGGRDILMDEHEEKELLQKVLWPSHEPLQFMRRRGGIPLDYAEYYEKYHQPENVKRWARLLGKGGMERLHFYKGMGLKMEREEIERTIEVARIMHAEGMVVSVYIGGTMHTDWFFKEVPEAKSWACVAADGGPITYMGYQLWRHFPCLNNPDFRKYYFKVIDVAIDEVHADEIFFDNQILRGEPRSCRCKVCLELFPKYVESKYTPEQRTERFGHPDVSGIRPPDWSESWPAGSIRTIIDPVIQEWIDFRCHNVYDFYLAMREHIVRKKPAVAVGMNIKGLHPHNLAFDNGIDHGRWQVPGFNCCDSGLHAGMGPRGNMLAEYRAYKITHTTALTQSGQGGIDDVLCLVMNKQLDVPGFGRRPQIGRELNVFGKLGGFLREQEEELYGARPIVADVAVLRSFPSMAYNCMNYIHGPLICEQGLWEHHIPFQIVFDQNMAHLTHYKVILLANQDALSNENLERLKHFVENGGGIVATESTGKLDDWRRKRVKNALTEIFGLNVGPKPHRVSFGKGRAAYIPKLTPAVAYENNPFRHPYATHNDCLPPKNWKEVEDALRWAAGGAFTFEVAAPKGIAAEFRQGPTPHDRVVHLVNLSGKPIRKPIKVRFTAEGKEAKEGKEGKEGNWNLELRSPDKLPAKAPKLSRKKDAWEFSLPGVEVYTACVLRPL